MRVAQSQRGTELIEVLVAIVIVTFGVLGFLSFQAQTTVSEMEAYQRSQALILVNDMAQRMGLNRTNALAYVANNIGTIDPGSCSAAPDAAAKDLCEWGLLLRGELEKSANIPIGALIGAIGCIQGMGGNQFVISIAWQGIRATDAPTSSCGLNAYSDEKKRRVVSTIVGFGTF